MARTHRQQDIFPITLRDLEVVQVRDITPNLRRITLAGEQLQAFAGYGVDNPEFISTGFDDDVRLVFPHPVTGDRPYPPPLGNGALDWTEEVKNLFRTYTVRRFDKGAGTVDIDFARHHDGLAEAFSAKATIGDKVYVVGPKRCAALPTHTDWLLLCGDHTALPAISRCLEELPQGHRVIAVIEVAERSDIMTLPSDADADIHWAVVAEGESFADLALSLRDSLPEGEGFVWAAGEAGALKQIRGLAKELGVGRENTEIVGYWREHTSTVAEDGTPLNTLMAIREKLLGMSNLLPIFAAQAALRSGVLARLCELTDGATPAQITESGCELDAHAAQRLLRYLSTTGLIIEQDGRFALSPELAEVVDYEIMSYLLVKDFKPEVMGLGEALRGGQSRGASPAAAGAQRHPLDSSTAPWTAPAVAAAISPQRTLSIGGPDAEVYAAEIASRTGVAVTVVVGDERELDQRAQAGQGEPEQAGITRAATWQGDSAMVITPCAQGPIEQLGELLERIAAAGISTCWIVEELMVTHRIHAEACENDLQRLCESGGCVPTQEEMTAVATDAGWRVDAVQPAGWGMQLLTLSR
ncbi:siderophore-interacting protein [Corynebacterium sp. TAE3-ERU30]|uniref:siderophore-interacting protein n=1 Tax=Corynebacterium sp. TAE3-ERU30 TaxID=2849496 RepID=UPI001C44318C|nr:siderophore-interacting protein [Corynebacterium sp. TAE3-ERU30]MBV7282079.1 SIP domain-containing protein [Corynebacterium sp. TAE3-ERU30]